MQATRTTCVCVCVKMYLPSMNLFPDQLLLVAPRKDLRHLASYQVASRMEQNRLCILLQLTYGDILT